MDKIIGGSTNISILFALDTAGLTIADMKLGYIRWTESDGTSFTEVVSSALTELAAITTAHTDNRAKYLDTEATGGNKFVLRVDFPDAAFAAGKDRVICNVYDDGNSVIAHRVFNLNDDDSIYQNGAIWVDTVNGSNPGTPLKYIHGTPTNPVNNMIDAKTLADAMGLNRFIIIGEYSQIDLGTIDFSAGYEFFSAAQSWIDFGSADIESCSFKGMFVSASNTDVAIGTGYIGLDDCNIGFSSNSVNLPSCVASNLAFQDRVFLADSGIYEISGLSAVWFDDTDCVLDFDNTASADPGVSNVVITKFSGRMTIKNMKTTDTIDISGDGEIVFDSSCNSGSAVATVRGAIKVTNNATALTLNDNTTWAATILSKYQDGFVYVDSALGSSGTVLGINGTVDNPCNTIANAKTLADQLQKRIAVSGAFTNVDVSLANYYVKGFNRDPQLDGDTTTRMSLGAAVLEDIKITGGVISNDETIFRRCDISAIDAPAASSDAFEGTCFDCIFSNTINLNVGAKVLIYNGASKTLSSIPIFNFVNPDSNLTKLDIRGWKGEIKIINMNNANHKASIYADAADVTLDTTITAGVIDLLGMGLLTDNKTSGTVNSDDWINGADVASIKTKTDSLPHSIKKNTAIAKFKFVMLDATTGNPTAGFSVTATKKLDAGGTWLAMPGSGTIVDNGSGVYSIDIAQADTNGDTGAWRFTAPGAETTLITFVTEAV